jgi:hypothetical protein
MFGKKVTDLIINAGEINGVITSDGEKFIG